MTFMTFVRHISRWVIAILALASCARSDPALEELGAETMAEYIPDSGERVSKSTSSDGEVLGIQTRGGIVSRFTPRSGVAAEELVTDLVDAARSDGWEVRERTPLVSYRGAKVLTHGEAQLDITFSAELGQAVVRMSISS